MQEMPVAILRGDNSDTLVPVKIHQMVWREGGRNQQSLLVYGSFVAPGNAVKIIRGGCTVGTVFLVQNQPVAMPPAQEGIFRYDLAYHRLADGHVHCAVKTVRCAGVVLMDESDDSEWRDEIMRVSSLPLLPEWTTVLSARIKKAKRAVELSTFNCKCSCYHLDDCDLEKILLAAINDGEISIPDCKIDIGGIGSLSEYIRIYAEKMIDSAGSALEPLFDPRKEQPVIPVLLRRPFRPQAWVMEGAKRMMLNME